MERVKIKIASRALCMGGGFCLCIIFFDGFQEIESLEEHFLGRVIVEPSGVDFFDLVQTDGFYGFLGGLLL